MDAEAEGIRNVGLGYLPHYLNHLRCGKLIGDANPEIVKQTASAVVVNANLGFCHTAYLHAEEVLKAGGCCFLGSPRVNKYPGIFVRKYKCRIMEAK